MLDIALLAFPDGSIWIFASLDDCSVRLFCIDQDNKFQERHVLKGKSICSIISLTCLIIVQ